MTALKFLVIGLVVSVLAACAAPIYNVDDVPVMTNAPNPTLDEVSNAIQRAGAGLGWQMLQDAPGHILGTLKLRSHVAVVDVNYDLKAFSIKYKDSTNLNYTSTSIHNNYNGWIQNLDNAIKAQLTSL